MTTGYLTGVERVSAKEYRLVIPNAEIRDLFIIQVKDWFRDTSRADLSRISKFCSVFPEGNEALIGEMLHDYLWDSISVWDTAVSDIVICTPDRVGIVIELKYEEDGNLEEGCADALEQIEARKYTVDLERRGIKKVLKYCMAFCEKECKVVLAEE